MKITFGTREIARFAFEAPEDGGGAPPEAPEAAPVEGAVEAAPEAPSEPEWSGVSRDEWEATVNYLQQTGPLMQQVAQMVQNGQLTQQQANEAMAPQQPEPSTLPEMDPWDPESVQNYIQASVHQGIQQGIQQELGPYQQMMNSIASDEGERMARAHMENLRTEIGEFDADAAYMIAAGALADDNLDPNQVLAGSARYMHEMETRIRADERQRYIEEMKNLQGAPQDGPIGHSAGHESQTVPTGPDRYKVAVQRALANRHPRSPVG